MTNEQMFEMIMRTLEVMDTRILRIEQQLYNKLTIAQILDVTDDRVHMVKQIVKTFETPNGIVVMIK
jgi:hypothetical protein